MRFSLLQLDNFTYTKPFVKVYGNDDWIQWDTCDLEGLPVDRVGISMTSHGKIPKGQWDSTRNICFSRWRYIYNRRYM